MKRTFETAALSDLPDDAVLECGVCWWVYDPDQGDELAGIEPHTPFTALPGDWRCPSCDAERAKFLLPEGGVVEAETPCTSETLETRQTALIAAYRQAEDAMVGLPVHNPLLEISAVGFQEFQDGFAGILITPWCMNIVVMPGEKASLGALGSQSELVFPSGAYNFTLSHLDGVGLLQSCSLFSPMDEFTSQQQAQETADAAAKALFTEPKAEPAPPREIEKPVSRRVLFTVGG